MAWAVVMRGLLQAPHDDGIVCRTIVGALRQSRRTTIDVLTTSAGQATPRRRPMGPCPGSRYQFDATAVRPRLSVTRRGLRETVRFLPVRYPASPRIRMGPESGT